MIVVDHPQTTYTHQALSQLSSSDVVLVVCGADHLPVSVLLPLADHCQVVWRIHAQIGFKLTFKKRLWQQIIKEKLVRQASNLPDEYPAKKRLIELSKSVRSGDTGNLEAQGAKIYWQNWLWQEEFHRNRDDSGVNSFLNYGYAIIRAALARAIVAAGLHPSLGIHHKNRSNAFCLADDLIEPLRPLVDDRARDLYVEGFDQLDKYAKAELLQLLTSTARIGNETGPLMTMLHRYVASLVRCMEGKSEILEIPTPC